MDQNVEMGMLSYEDRSDIALAFVYEIFVLPQFRERGVAAMLLSQLESWYMRAGYLRSAEYPELMEKPLPILGQA